MIYEMRTYTLKPGSVREFESKWAEMIDRRQQLSPLAALWHTEIGPLNQMIHVWPYESLAERQRIRDEASAQGIWPPRTPGLILKMESDILLPAPFMRPIKPRAMGSIYEMRTYTYRVGTLPEILKRFGEAVPYREKHSPLAACWYSDLGPLNRFIHVWPYANLAERDRVREEAGKDGHWPPGITEFLDTQETKILAPASFSPLH